jgi:hypothetical protein
VRRHAFAHGGGVGLAIAQWMIDGEPDSDIFAMDVARFGAYASRPYAIVRGDRVLRQAVSDCLS